VHGITLVDSAKKVSSTLSGRPVWPSNPCSQSGRDWRDCPRHELAPAPSSVTTPLSNRADLNRDDSSEAKHDTDIPSTAGRLGFPVNALAVCDSCNPATVALPCGAVAPPSRL